MKLKILTYIFLLFSLGSFSQDYRHPAKGLFGIKGGAVFSDLTPIRIQDYRVSFQLGIVGQFQLKPKAHLVTEFFYSNEGSRQNGNNINLYNFVVPILFKADMNHWLSWEVGTQLNVIAGHKLYSGGVDRGLTMGLCAGLSAYVDPKNYFNLRYSRGILPIFVYPKIYSSSWALTFVKVF